jgi:hypothetical protein
MSIDYLHVKNGFFMTEKFNFENLSAFNSTEGIIFYPLAVKVALSAAKERFFTGYVLWKACNGQMSRFSPRFENF